MKYFVIGDEDTVLGLGMAGVQGRIVHDSVDAKQTLLSVLADKEVGIIIITERTADLIRAVVDKFMFTGTFPLILEIPDRRGPALGRLGIRAMVDAAIGIKL